MTFRRRKQLLRRLVLGLAVAAIAAPAAQAQYPTSPAVDDAIENLSSGYSATARGLEPGMQPYLEALKTRSEEANRIYGAGSVPPDALDRFLRNNPTGLVEGTVIGVSKRAMQEGPLGGGPLGSTATGPQHGLVEGPTVVGVGTNAQPAAPWGVTTGVFAKPVTPIVRDTPDGYQPQLHTPGPVASFAERGAEKLPVSAPQPTPVSADGFDWRDAGIGFGIAIAVALVAGGLAMGLRNRGRLVTSH
jgi:hypothetical protein